MLHTLCWKGIRKPTLGLVCEQDKSGSWVDFLTFYKEDLRPLGRENLKGSQGSYGVFCTGNLASWREGLAGGPSPAADGSGPVRASSLGWCAGGGDVKCGVAWVGIVTGHSADFLFVPSFVLKLWGEARLESATLIWPLKWLMVEQNGEEYLLNEYKFIKS